MRLPFLIVVCCLLCVPCSFADELACSDEAHVGGVYFGNQHELLLDGTYGYGVHALDGLSVFDISDPFNHTELANIPFFGGTLLVRHGDVLIVGDDTYLPVQIVDIRDPANPQALSEIDVYPEYVCAEGDDLLIVAGDSMHVFDISDPSRPVFIDRIRLPSWMRYGQFEVVDGQVYVKRFGWVWAFDLRDALNGKHKVTMLLEHAPSGIFLIEDGFMYVAGYDRGLAVYDLREPQNVIEAYRENSVGVNDLKLVGSTLYLANDRRGVRVVDVTDPYDPVTIDALSSNYDSMQVWMNDGYIYSAGSNYTITSLAVFDISLMRRTARRSSVSLTGQRGDVVADDSIACVVDGNELRIVDISEPQDAIETGVFSFIGLPEDVVDLSMHAGVLYVAGTDGLIRMIDIGDIEDPTLIGTIDVGDPVLAMELEGGHMFIGCAHAGLQIFDLSSPTQPMLVGEFRGDESEARVPALDAREGLVSVAIEGVGIHLLDVQVPSAPVFLSRTGLRRDILDITLGDGEAYYCKIVGSASASPDTKLYRVDIRDTSSPSIVDQVWFDNSDGSEAAEFEIKGRYGYLRDGDRGVMVFDLEDADDPLRHVGTYRAEGIYGRGRFSVTGDSLVYAGRYLEVLDIRDGIGCSTCLSDFDGDTDVDADDVRAYIEAHADHEAYADLNFDGEWDYFDVRVFIETVRDGCP